jgi:transcriptional regulator with XRE-family HTH domain
MATRRTNREILDEWLEKNGPDGVTQLAYKSGVSASTISKARFGISVPKKPSTRNKICAVLGVSEDVLFPFRGKRSA